MKMSAKTVANLNTLHNAISENAILNRYTYKRLRSIIGANKVPSWGTLKNHNLVVFVGQTILFEDGFEEEFVVVNSYRVNF